MYAWDIKSLIIFAVEQGNESKLSRTKGCAKRSLQEQLRHGTFSTTCLEGNKYWKLQPCLIHKETSSSVTRAFLHLSETLTSIRPQIFNLLWKSSRESSHYFVRFSPCLRFEASGTFFISTSSFSNMNSPVLWSSKILLYFRLKFSFEAFFSFVKIFSLQFQAQKQVVYSFELDLSERKIDVEKTAV